MVRKLTKELARALRANGAVGLGSRRSYRAVFTIRNDTVFVLTVLVGCAGSDSFFGFSGHRRDPSGVAVTDDADLADHMKTISLHGLSHDTWNRFGRGFRP